MATTEDAEAAHVIVHGTAAGFAQKIEIGSHHLDADEPAAFGGTDTGASPYDLLLAALGSCTSMTVGFYARNDAGRSRISPFHFDTPGSTQLTARIARRKKERSIGSSSTFSSPVRSLPNSARNLWKSPSAVRFIRHSLPKLTSRRARSRAGLLRVIGRAMRCWSQPRFCLC